MGEGAKAGLPLHYDSRTYPKTLDELNEDGAVSEHDVPTVSETLRRKATESPPSDD